MMNSDVKSVIARGDWLLGRRGNLLSFWQDTADNFYPERGQFTYSRSVGEDFAAHLQTSYPLIVRRELGNAIAAMLRPRDQQWGAITVDRDDRLDSAGRQWLEFATGVQWRAMYDREAQFVRATKEGDHDFATFGQAVITREINWEKTALLYRCWHIKDCAWAEDSTGTINELHINWTPTVQQLCEKFPKTVCEKARGRLAKDPFGEVRCRRIILPSECYAPIGEMKRRQPFVALYVDLDNETVLEASGRWNKGFTLPRWQTVSGSPYAYSPAVIAALPDARLIQAMTLTLLEAGEMAVRPPILGKQDVIRSDLNLYPGGVTWANVETDTKLDDVLRPIYQEKSGIPLGLEMNQDIRQQLEVAFYLNKLSLPPATRAMTAYETSQRLQEWIRAALPLFEPMEQEYNGDLCEGTFEDLMRVGAFGPYEDIPDSIRGERVKFRFESPLHEAIERKKGQLFLEAKEMLVHAAELDQTAVDVVDVRKALRDALQGIGLSAKLMRDEEEVEQMAAAAAEAQRAEQLAMQVAGGAEAAKQVGEAKRALEGVA